MSSDQQVLQQSGVGEQLDVLERARDAQPSDAIRRNVGDVPVLEEQPARGRCVYAADQVEDGRLASAVRADDGKYLARLHIEAYRVDCTDTAEADGDIFGSEQAHRSRSERA